MTLSETVAVYPAYVCDFGGVASAASAACQLVGPEKAEVVVVVETSTANVLRERGGAECPADIYEYFAGDVELTTG